MAKIKAPLFSLDASGTLDKTLTYRKKPQNNTASKYAKPGDINPFVSSPRQKDQRSIIGLITACWQSKTSLDQLAWNNTAKAARFKGTGYHYFLHLAKTDLKTYLGLVGFWSMNYNIGDKIPDLSGQNNHGTLSPIYPCDCPQPVDSFNIKHGKALSFNGSTHFINFSGLPNFPAGNSDRSVEMWVKRNSITEFWDGLFFYGSRLTGKGFMFHFYNNTNQLSISRYGGDSFSTIAITLGVWYHIAATLHNSDQITYYINGIKDGPYTLSGINTVLFQSYMGKGGGGWVSPDFHGVIDSTYYWDKTLSEFEIQRHYSLLI